MAATMENPLLSQNDILMDLRELDSHLGLFDEPLRKDEPASDTISASLVVPVDAVSPSHTITVESPDASFPRGYQSEIVSHSRKSVFSNITQYVIQP